jgi:hypothetical protein
MTRPADRTPIMVNSATNGKETPRRWPRSLFRGWEMKSKVVWLIVLLFPLLGEQAFADERILSYHADVAIAADGELTVVETIRVRAERREIRRGIYRDFPTRYRDRYGRRVRVPFEVLSVTRDGRQEPWRVESAGAGRRVYIGSADVFLNPGEYAYELTYRTNRQIGFFEEHDELYWNVTGNDWIFPIDRAVATVRLPEAVPAEHWRLDAYTGPEGAQGGDYRVEIVDARGVRFQTSRVLGPREGLTIAVGFPKGIIAPPTTAEIWIRFLGDNLGGILGLVGLQLTLAWYLFAWFRVGRDPAPGAIYARYGAPEGYSPGMLRYVWRMGYDTTTMAAALVSLGLKNALGIEKQGSTYQVEKKDGRTDSKTENALLKTLFNGGRTLRFETANHSRVGGAVKAHERALSARLEGRYFNRNRWWLVPGILLSLLAAVAMVALAPVEEAGLAIFLTLFLVVWNSATFAMVVGAARSWRDLKGVVGKAQALLTTLFTLPFVVAGLVVIGLFAWLVGVVPLLVLLGLLAINVLFYQLIKAPTLLGRRLLDHIEGLRLYLNVAERQEIESRHRDAPPQTLEEFERLLPYAIALDAADTWGGRFADAIRRAEQAGTAQTRSWYPVTTSGGGGFSTAGLTGGLASGLAGAVASSSRAPGSGSGGGGGGSSGGGGGGGGGGGW